MINSLRSLVKKTVKAELLEYCQLADDPQTNEVLDKFLQEINAAHFHPYQAGGKLVRPLLLVLMAGSFGGSRGISNALSAGAAVECAHTYSLVHDDLPCMDNDSLRRGQPTVHTVYGDAKGLLVGDGLLTAAFELLSHSRSLDENLKNRSDLILELTKVFSHAIGMRGMIWGQWLDISEPEFEAFLKNASSKAVWEIFQTIHQNKTGKLFAASLVMGFLCGIYSESYNVSQEKIVQIKNQIFQIGLDIGMIFQIIDDLLDATQTTEQLGKTSGKDNLQNKLTAVSILGLDEAEKYVDQLMKTVNTNLETIMVQNCFLEKNTKEYFDELINFINTLQNRLS